jgi:hypothetical protein
VKLTAKDVTPALKSSVNAYLVARAFAEVMRERVNVVYQEVLQIHPLYEDMETRRRGKGEPKRIFNPDRMYLSTDEETCSEVYAEVNLTLRERGIKQPETPDDHCPALVAEHLQTKAEHLIIESAAAQRRCSRLALMPGSFKTNFFAWALISIGSLFICAWAWWLSCQISRNHYSRRFKTMAERERYITRCRELEGAGNWRAS